MGEDFRPELVTVQPLTRGTWNQSVPTVSSGGRFGGSGPTVLEKYNYIRRTNHRQKNKKVALEDIDCRYKILYIS